MARQYKPSSNPAALPINDAPGAPGQAAPAPHSGKAPLRLRHDLLDHDDQPDPKEPADHLPAEAGSPERVERRSRADQRRAKALEELDAELQEESETGLERRRGVGRRRSDWARAAEEGEMTREQFLFIKAIDGFKRANDVMYPTWTDVLEVVRLLGYRKTLKCELKITGAEDWTEKPDALSRVRSKPGHPEQAQSAQGQPARKIPKSTHGDQPRREVA